MDFELAIIGGGSIGEALATGAVVNGQYSPDRVIVSDPLASRRDYLKELINLEVTADNRFAVQNAETIVLAVKPQFFFSTLNQIKDVFKEDKLLISVAAGIGTKEIEDFLDRKVPVVRVMTNTPLLIGEGATVLTRGKFVIDEQLQRAKKLFLDLGLTIELPENDLNGVTALSGSGPAYIYLIIDALIEAGVRIGLNRELSRELILQTISGSVKMMLETNRHPAELKESVTSPGGTTAAALEHMESEGIRGILIKAVVKAFEKAEELSLVRE